MSDSIDLDELMTALHSKEAAQLLRFVDENTLSQSAANQLFFLISQVYILNINYVYIYDIYCLYL